MNRQLHRRHGRRVARPEFFAHRIVLDANGVFACGKIIKIAVFKRYGSVFGHCVIAAVDQCVTVVQCFHGIAVQLNI